MKIKDTEFNKFFKEYNAKVYSLCFRYLQNQEDAKDLMQECFVSLYYKYEQYDSSRGSFEAWFYTLCKNNALGELRKSKKKIPVEILDEIPEVQLDEIEQNKYFKEELMIDYIQQLPNGYKTVLELFAIHNWSHKMIAEHLNIKESTSRSQYYKAKRFLSELVQNTEI